MLPLVPIISGGLNLLSQGVDYFTNKALVKQQNKQQMKLAEYGYSNDLEMWNKQNQYNTPTAQMERLKAAGLNPALVYGNGAVGNTSGSIPHYNTPTVNRNEARFTAPELLSIINQYQDSKYKSAVTDQVRKSIELKNKDLELKGIDQAIKTSVSLQKSLDYKKAANLEKYSYDLAKANLEKKYQEIKKGIYELQKKPYQVENEQLKNSLLKSDVELRKIGITDRDNIFIRLLMRRMVNSKKEINYQKLVRDAIPYYDLNQ